MKWFRFVVMNGYIFVIFHTPTMFFLFRVYHLVAHVNSGTIFFKYFSFQMILIYKIYDMFAVSMLPISITFHLKQGPSKFFCLQNPMSWFFCMDLFLIILCITLTFCMCLYSDYIANKISSHGKITYDLNWHQLPVELRKYVLLMIHQAQASVQFSGFKIVYMHLRTFAQVISFFLTLIKDKLSRKLLDITCDFLTLHAISLSTASCLTILRCNERRFELRFQTRVGFTHLLIFLTSHK